MTRREITAFLSALMRKKLNGKYYASEVTFNWGIEQGIVTGYEVKSCVDDFRSPNGHNLLFDKNYYVMPMSTRNTIVSQKHHAIGIYVPHRIDVTLKEEQENPTDFTSIEYTGAGFNDGWTLSCVDKSKLLDRNIPIASCLFNMLRSGK